MEGVETSYKGRSRRGLGVGRGMEGGMHRFAHRRWRHIVCQNTFFSPHFWPDFSHNICCKKFSHVLSTGSTQTGWLRGRGQILPSFSLSPPIQRFQALVTLSTLLTTCSSGRFVHAPITTVIFMFDMFLTCFFSFLF